MVCSYNHFPKAGKAHWKKSQDAFGNIVWPSLSALVWCLWCMRILCVVVCVCVCVCVCNRWWWMWLTQEPLKQSISSVSKSAPLLENLIWLSNLLEKQKGGREDRWRKREKVSHVCLGAYHSLGIHLMTKYLITWREERRRKGEAARREQK